ncbi:hypothetical protein V5O48_003014 [Marasmius crinis-equi]|uniref:JmjC domain-containing protein n=1 Tax=Marasmius crinis-equi TaxID=585013 RepID=A0ABR3FU00_9AGAR
MESIFVSDSIQAQPPEGTLITHEPSETIKDIGMYPWRTTLLFHGWDEIKNGYLDHRFSVTAQSILSEISTYIGKRLKGKTFDFTEAIVASKGTGRGLIIRLAFALIFLDRAPMLLGGLKKMLPPPSPIPRTRIVGKKSLNVRPLKLLGNWPTFFREAELALEAYDSAGLDKRELESMDFNRGNVADVRTNMISKCLRHLQNIKCQINELKVHTITLNIELCALYLHWFSLGHADLPHSSTEFKSQLKKNKNLDGQVLPSGTDAYDVTKLRTALHTALALSPLIVLSPEINLFTQDPQASNMLHLWFHFGNQQPRVLKALDGILWEEMNSVDGCHRTALDALRSILQRAKPFLCDIDDESRQWFSRAYGEVNYREQTPIWPWISKLPDNERDGTIEPDEERNDDDYEDERVNDNDPATVAEDINVQLTIPKDEVCEFPHNNPMFVADSSNVSANNSASVRRFSELTGFDSDVDRANQWLDTAIQHVPEHITINHISLTGKDLCRLQRQNWINDEIINAFFRCFEFPVDCWVLSSLLWTMSIQKLETRQAKTSVPREIERNKNRFMSSVRIMIPIHDTLSNHWIAVAVDRDTSKITVYDSLASAHRKNDDQLRRKCIKNAHLQLQYGQKKRNLRIKEFKPTHTIVEFLRWRTSFYMVLQEEQTITLSSKGSSLRFVQRFYVDCSFENCNITPHTEDTRVETVGKVSEPVASGTVPDPIRDTITDKQSLSSDQTPVPKASTSTAHHSTVISNVVVDVMSTESMSSIPAAKNIVTDTPNIASKHPSSSLVVVPSEITSIVQENKNGEPRLTCMTTSISGNDLEAPTKLKSSRVEDQHKQLSRRTVPSAETKVDVRRSSREKKPVQRSPVVVVRSVRPRNHHVGRKTSKGIKMNPTTVVSSPVEDQKVSKHYVASQIALNQPDLVRELRVPRKGGKTYQITTYASDVYFWRTFFLSYEAEEQLDRLFYASGEMKIAPNTAAKYPEPSSLLSQPNLTPQRIHPNPFPVKCIVPLAFDEYQTRHSHELQLLFRSCPLVLSNVPRMHRNSSWDSSTLRRLGCIHIPRQVHDNSIIPIEHPNEVIVKTSLNDALTIGEKVNLEKPLNFLDLPGYGDFYCDNLLASELHAYKQTVAYPQLLSPIPQDNIWHLVATKDVFTPFHMDAEGMAVALLVEVGAKLIFMLVPSSRDISEASNIHYSLDMDPDANRTWSSAITNGQIGNLVGWEVQGVLLRPGDMLFMPPGTYHFVYSLEPSICHGRHFLCASTIRQTCWALFHAFVMGRSVTNTDHTKNRTSLVRLMVFWHKEFVERNWQPDSLQQEDSVHMPEWASMTGFIDFLSLSNIFEFGPTLWLETYDGTDPDDQHVAEFDLARLLSRQIFDRYTKLFNVRVIDKTIGHYIRSENIWEDIRCSFMVQQMICLLRHSHVAFQRNFSDIPSVEKITSKFEEHFLSTGTFGKRAWDRFCRTKGDRASIATLFPNSETCESYEWTYHSHMGNSYTFQLYTTAGTVYDDVEWSAVQEELDVAMDLEGSLDHEYVYDSCSESSSGTDLSEDTEDDHSQNYSRNASRELDMASSDEDQALSQRGSSHPSEREEQTDTDEDNMSVLSLEMWNHVRMSNHVNPLPSSIATNNGNQVTELPPSPNIASALLDANTPLPHPIDPSSKRRRISADVTGNDVKRQKTS